MSVFNPLIPVPRTPAKSFTRESHLIGKRLKKAEIVRVTKKETTQSTKHCLLNP